ncbi:MAG: hypothetical protein IT198_08385 [Acidimicrobiia bacterium]|nr:hypothetical protein [Acidimicrobiia bacterium]
MASLSDWVLQGVAALLGGLFRLLVPFAVLAFLVAALFLAVGMRRLAGRFFGFAAVVIVGSAVLTSIGSPDQAWPPGQGGQDSCVSADTGLDACAIESGDILLSRGTKNFDRFWIENWADTHFIHTAIAERAPDGGVTVIEAPGRSSPPGGPDEVRRVPLARTAWWTHENGFLEDWVVLRPPLPAVVRAEAATHAGGVADDNANVYDILATKADPHHWYCSKLVWAAYQSVGFDVEVEDPNPVDRVLAGHWVTPDDVRRGGGAVVQAR